MGVSKKKKEDRFLREMLEVTVNMTSGIPWGVELSSRALQKMFDASASASYVLIKTSVRKLFSAFELASFYAIEAVQ